MYSSEYMGQLVLKPGEETDVAEYFDTLDEENAFQSAGVLAQFPDEIWEAIFLQVKQQASWEELLKCSRVCKKWERFVREDECNWLFDQVLPFLFPYLRTPDIFLVRRVNKTWQRTVDNFIQNHKHWQPFTEQTPIFPLQRISIDSMWNFGITCSSSGKLAELEARMSMSDFINPFPGRSFYLKLTPWDTIEERRQIRTAITNFFKIFGCHLWRFSICAPFSLTIRPTYDYDSFLELVQSCLVHMPHLKTLHIRGMLTFAGNLTQQEEESLLQVMTESHPFLLNYSPSIETLLINTVGVPAAVRTYITGQFASQLKCLRYFPYLENYQFMANVPLPNLTEYYTAIPSNKSLTELQEFLTAVAETSPYLRKLKLRFLPMEEPEKLNLRSLFEMLSVFGESLVWLYLEFVNGDGGVIYPRDMQMLLPSLKKLTLRGFGNIPFTLLHRLPVSLESLELYHHVGDKIRNNASPNEGPSQNEHFRMSMSIDKRIWKDLPKLRMIRYHGIGTGLFIRRRNT